MRSCAGTILISLAVVLFGGPLDANSRSEEIESVRQFDISGGTDEQEAAVEFALRRMEYLPGPMPNLEIRILEPSGCQGKAGVFRAAVDPWQIDLCRVEMFVILHELAHAWTKAHISAPVRAGYINAQKLETWSDAGIPRDSRGSEHAADTIAWGLLPRPLGSFSPDGPLARRQEAFCQLTGVAPPRIEVATC